MISKTSKMASENSFICSRVFASFFVCSSCLFLLFCGCAVFTRARWDTVFYERICMWALCCRQRRFLFWLCFPSCFRMCFFGVLAYKNYENSCKCEREGKSGLQMPFWTSLGRFLISREGTLGLPGASRGAPWPLWSRPWVPKTEKGA